MASNRNTTPFKNNKHSGLTSPDGNTAILTRSARKKLEFDIKSQNAVDTANQRQAYTVNTSNRYKELEQEDENESEKTMYNSITEETDYSNNSNTSSPSTILSGKNHPVLLPNNGNKTVPIIIKKYGEPYPKVIERIKKVCKTHFTLKYLKDSVSVRTETKEDYTNLLQFLKQNNLPAHTYTLPEDKQKVAILKGLPPDYTENEVLTEVSSKVGEEFVLSCNLLVTARKDVLPIYLVRFKGDISPLTVIKSTPRLFYTRVYWEKYHPRNKVTQCYNCQAYGHGSRNCTYKPRCFKCGEDHNSRECRKPKEEKPTCANCREDHLSNNRCCKAYKDYMAKIEKNTTRRKDDILDRELAKPRARGSMPANTHSNFPAFPQKQRSWTKPPNDDPGERHADSDSNKEDFMELLDTLKQINQICNVKDMLQKAKNLLRKLQSAKDDGAKIEAFLTMLDGSK